MNPRRISILMAGLVACTGIGRGAAPGARGSGEILLGMSTALSGPAASMGEEMRTGVLAALERANRAGAIRGQRLRLIALDDGYEPLRTVPNKRQSVEKDEVLAVIGNVGTPTAIAAHPIATEHKTLFYGAFTGASYAEEMGAMIDALLDRAGLQVADIAFLTHDIRVLREFEDVPSVTVEKHKVLQILVTRIFNHGFTTRKHGHGFGLHSGALVAKEMGGSLRVQSDGAGQGATITLQLPIAAKAWPS